MAASWAIGAYVTALLWNYFHLTPWLGIPVAHGRRVARRAADRLPCFRFRIIGHYFALVTLALSAIVLQVITATRDITGGSLGYTPQRYNGGSSILALQFTDKVTWYLIALGRVGGRRCSSAGASIAACCATRWRRSPRTRTRRRAAGVHVTAGEAEDHRC